ncbi:LysR family transcriptional regulator [Castellaniella sp.]|uniref:LysR family transcriptional regulator n=1 Tax=Castellaniella sp. TaxID=1955812 RepID=UPI003A8E9FE8
MEIRQLEALNAVVSTGSVTAAGRLLGRSQPVVSRQISDLEAELGFVLFERTRPNITLTESGAEFHQQARGILADLKQLEGRVLGMRNGQQRPLRILVTSDLARSILPLALAFIDPMHPVFHQAMVVEEAVHEITPQDIFNSRADFALINLPIDTEGLRVHWCGQAPCQLALPAHHPLASSTDMLHLDNLTDTDVITLLGRYRMRYHLTNRLVQATSASTRRHIEVGSQQTALAMVRAGLGVALIDPFTVQANLLEGLVLRPVRADVHYRIGVVSQRSHEVSDGAQRLIRGLHQHVRNTVAQFVDVEVNGMQSEARPCTEITPIG